MNDIVSNSSQNDPMDLFVDLDGTLIAGDIALESLARAMRRIGVLTEALRAYKGTGLGGLKRTLAMSLQTNVETLPYRPEVLDHIRKARAQGRRVILATAADSTVAQAVADHLGLFDAVLASEPGRNLKGTEKLRAIKEMASGPFEYLGDSAADVPIWQAAQRVGFVAPRGAARAHMASMADKTSLHIESPTPAWRALLRAMRPHQWAKNVLVFAPILFAHAYLEADVLLAGMLAFMCFSLCASSVYLLNDITDIHADRQHATKRNRPFAAGHLSIPQGLVAAAILLSVSLVTAFWWVNMLFGLVMLGYTVLTTAYTFCLKRYSTADVVALSLLYTVRILAGSAATLLAPSPWLLSYSLFFFLSLAYMKRYIELDRMSAETPEAKLPARNYYASEVQLVMTFGIANGALSVLTLAQYVNSPAVHVYYATPFLLWLIVPIMMFWIYRSWTWASRGRIADDPIFFALKDRISRLTVMLVIGVIFVARFLDFPHVQP